MKLSQRRKQQHEQRDDRFFDILERRLNGETLQEIGEAHGITKSRAAQVFANGVWRFRLAGKIDFMLGVRVSNIDPCYWLQNDAQTTARTQ